MSRLLNLFFGIAGVLIIAAYFGVVFLVLGKVASGHGADTTFTVAGISIDNTGLLIIVLLVPALLVLCWRIQRRAAK